MNNLFKIVGDSFFRPLSSQYKDIYIDCLNIIYESYRSELSYGTDREILVIKLSNYFDKADNSDIVLDDDTETLRDSRSKAHIFLRKLREYGWIEYEISNDGSQRIIMPGYAVTMVQTLKSIARKDEMEYQSEISAIYSLLTNEELMNRPYPQIIKPVYERTLSLFTGLKKLNTEIKKYIEEITADKTSEEIIHDFFEYHEEIGSRAYHRIKTSDNIARFRNTIINRLQSIRSDDELLRLSVMGYQNIENETDYDTAHEHVLHIISDIIDHFNFYDDIVKEIDRKHSKYIHNAVERAKFLLLNTNNIEGKLSSVLQTLAASFNAEESSALNEDAPEDVCRIFNIFPQGFLSGESLRTIPVSRKITSVNEIYAPLELSAEERELRRIAISEKNKNRFSRKNITEFVYELLKNREEIKASELEITSRRDMIRIIFISMYAHSRRSEYCVIPTEETISSQGFTFRDFTIKRRLK